MRSSHFPTRERSARRAFFRDVVCKAVERPHATQARLLSFASGRENIPRWQTPKKHFPQSRRSRLASPPLPPNAAGLRVRAMAAEDKSRIGLCGLAVMGQVRPSQPPRSPVRFGRTCVTAHRDGLTPSCASRARTERFPFPASSCGTTVFETRVFLFRLAHTDPRAAADTRSVVPKRHPSFATPEPGSERRGEGFQDLRVQSLLRQD